MDRKFKISMIISFCLFSSCSFFNFGDYLASDIEIFLDSPVWTVAEDVDSENTDEIESFFEKNPDLIDYQEEKFGFTLLIWACYNSKYKSIRALIDSGADTELKSKQGKTALIYLCRQKNYKIVEFLIDNGADVNFSCDSCKREKTPLSTAARSGNYEVFKLLVENGAIVSKKNYSLFSSVLIGRNWNLINFIVVNEKFDENPLMDIVNNDSVYQYDKIERIKTFNETDSILKEETLRHMRNKNLTNTPLPKDNEGNHFNLRP